MAGLASICLIFLALVPTTSSAAQAKSVRAFDLRLRDVHCGYLKFCGNGVLSGFGRVTSISTFRPAGTSPAPGCTNYKGKRVLTLANDADSSVTLAVKGLACGHYRGWGTFAITSGVGAFGRAEGSGVLLGNPLALHYYGVIVVAR